ncbi:MAG: hypothetical protein ACOYIE_03260 [Agathobaculum sp.]|jgi:hypothetical protein|uniref:hypothetical protein n=1 Tax=Agathobaculum sp. TaxID=2048138 RepID=UPI003D8FDE74
MQEERSFVYTIILGICMLLSLLMIGRMLLGNADGANGAVSEPQPQADEEENGMRLSESELGVLIEQALPFAPEKLTVSIGADGLVQVGALVNKQALSDAATEGLRTVLLFLPEKCEVSGAWQVSAENGKIVLACRQITAAGFTLPEQVAQGLSERLADTLNSQIEENKIEWSQLNFTEGALLLQQ